MEQFNKDEFYKQLNSIAQAEQPEESTVLQQSENHEGVTFEDENSETIQFGMEEAQETQEENEGHIQSEAEEVGENPKPKKESRYINRERLNEEIEKRNRIQQEFEAERRRAAELQSQLEAYNRIIDQASSQKEMGASKQEEEAIDPLDVETYQYFENRIKDLESRLVNQSENLTRQQEEARIAQTVNYHEKEFANKNPDFQDAFKHLMEAEKANHTYLVGDESQAAQMVAEKVKGILINAVKNGRNSAEIIYNMAKNYGYAPKAIKKSGGANLSAINRNMDRSASISDIPSSAGAPTPRTYSNAEDFELLKRPDGRGTDPKAFHKALESLNRLKGI